MDDVVSFLYDHRFFVIVALVINALTSVTKRAFKRRGWNGDRRWAILHIGPVVLGALFGFIPGIPCPEPAVAGRVMYFVGSGVGSTWLYRFVVQYAKKKGYDMSMSRSPSTAAPPADALADLVKATKTKDK